MCMKHKIWLSIDMVVARNLHISRNILVDKECDIFRAHTALRFQWQNNRSLWSMLPNRFGVFIWKTISQVNSFHHCAILYCESNRFSWLICCTQIVCGVYQVSPCSANINLIWHMLQCSFFRTNISNCFTCDGFYRFPFTSSLAWMPGKIVPKKRGVNRQSFRGAIYRFA